MLQQIWKQPLEKLLLCAQVVYFRPADILRQNMIKFVPIEDRLAFQSAANEAISVLLKLASQRAGFHIESITQVCIATS